MYKYIDDNNIEKELKSLKVSDIIFYNSKHISVDNLCRLSLYKPSEIEEEEIPNLYYMQNKKDIQVIIYVKNRQPVYRREKLINYFNNKFGEEHVLVIVGNELDVFCNKTFVNNIVNMPVVLGNKKDPIVIFTYPNKQLMDIVKFSDKIIYDKYDYYEDVDIEEQFYSKFMTLSSYELYNNGYNIINKERYYIPNGCDVVEYKPVKKYETKTAVYAGYNLNKVNFNIFALLKAVNEDWDIKIYGPADEELKSKYPDLEFCGAIEQSKLTEELSKCHLGLNLIDYDDYTKGQLSDKFFNYCNAHIPTLLFEEFKPNYKDYESAVKYFDFSELSLDKYIENLPEDSNYEKILEECDWNKRFDNLYKLIEEKI